MNPIANILQGDVKEVLKTVPDNFYDGCFCDPPYGLHFMSKKWDYDVPKKDTWKEVYRTLKPGAYLLAFGGTRTYHRLVCEIEDAGFNIKDTLTFLYGSGFPKSFNISKKLKSEEQDEEAEIWKSYGTALKPAVEFILLAQREVEGTYASNCLKWGCGGLNIDGCRIGIDEAYNITEEMLERSGGIRTPGQVLPGLAGKNNTTFESHEGRFPANLLLDEESAILLDKQSGITKSTGGVSRFFYCSKTSKKERNAGLDECEDKILARSGGAQVAENKGEQEYTEGQGIGLNRLQTVKNPHPTLKPIALNSYLAKLILPPDRHDNNNLRKILVPFAGTASEMIGSGLSGWDYIEGIEQNMIYVEIARKRIEFYLKGDK
jgi:site-specific DNA-methyltransferase (adenine-specific)